MVVSELRGEKIDIIPYNEEPARFVAKALSPARVREVLVDDDDRQATVIVPDDQLSLAIGREGQNARLAAKLTGWRVDIVGETEFAAQGDDGDFEEEGEEAADGRCAAVLSAGRRCPNASLAGSRFCGLPQHQALVRFDTNQVTVLSSLSDDEVSVLADPESADADVDAIVARAEAAFAEAEAEGAEEAAAEESAESEELAPDEIPAEEELAADAEAVEEAAEAEPEAVAEAQAEETAEAAPDEAEGDANGVPAPDTEQAEA
jgi:N utilization substance protein A